MIEKSTPLKSAHNVSKLLSDHAFTNGLKCLFNVARIRLQTSRTRSLYLCCCTGVQATCPDLISYCSKLISDSSRSGNSSIASLFAWDSVSVGLGVGSRVLLGSGINGGDGGISTSTSVADGGRTSSSSSLTSCLIGSNRLPCCLLFVADDTGKDRVSSSSGIFAAE